VVKKFLRHGIASGIAFGLTFAMGIAYCGIANANPVSWTNASGSEADFSYSNGSDVNGIAGSPNTVNDGFQFTVDHFKVDVSGGNSGTVGETINVTLTPKPGLRISSITANLTGDYSVLSTLQPAGVGYEADLQVAKHGSAGTVASNLVDPDDFTSGAAPISDGFAVNIPSTVTGPIDLTFDANLHGGSLQASAATIELKFLQLGVTTAQAPPAVPLPAAVATFPLGAMVAGWARKRFAK
jgi:hypothetical protein